MELETTLELTQDLQLGASFDYMDLDYKEFATGVPASQIAALDATRTIGRPPRKYGVNARCRLPLAPEVGNISVQAHWNWQDDSGDVSQPGGVIPAFGLLNLALNWDGIAGKPMDASLFASNLTDKVYSVGGLPVYAQFGISTERFGEPRMYGIRLRYNF